MAEKAGQLTCDSLYYQNSRNIAKLLELVNYDRFSNTLSVLAFWLANMRKFDTATKREKKWVDEKIFSEKSSWRFGMILCKN